MVWVASSDAEYSAIQSLQNDSDRAVAIVGAALVETRLEQALKSHFQQDAALLEKMFGSSAPLGSFSAKIRLAFLMGLISKQFHKELENMKEIRNRFAHDLEANSFDDQSIADRCKNFKLIEDICREPADMERAGGQNMRLALKDCVNELKKPRRRYILSAAVFTSGLWHASRRLTSPNIANPWM